MACLCEAENHTFRTRGASGQEGIVWDVGGLGAAVDTMLEKPGRKKHERVIHEADMHMQHGRTYEHVATRRVRVQSHTTCESAKSHDVSECKVTCQSSAALSTSTMVM